VGVHAAADVEEEEEADVAVAFGCEDDLDVAAVAGGGVDGLVDVED
jgi:hypothetical protein